MERRRQWGHSLIHEAQRLRDETVEQAAYDAEVERLRGEGLPVLSGDEATEARHALRVERLHTAGDEPVPAEDWPNVPSAAVLITEEWHYPEDEADTGSDSEISDEEENEYEDAEPVKVYVPVWVITDPAAAEKAGYVVPCYALGGSTGQAEEETDEQVEARREERRTVIANNKAWASVLLTALRGTPMLSSRRDGRHGCRAARVA